MPRWWIVSPTHAMQGARVPADAPREWCYLGTDPQQRRRVAKALAFAREVSVQEALTRLAYELKQPFLDWIAETGAHQPDAVAWWGSALASKSPLQTDLFLLVCSAELVRSWIEGASGTTSRIVVVEDPWLGLVLRRHLGGEPRVVFRGVGAFRCARVAAAWIVKAPLATGFLALWAVKTRLAVRRTFRGAPSPLEGLAQRAVLIYTWIQPRSVSRPGALTDPWTGRLEDILTSRGECIKRLTPLAVASTLLEPLRAVAGQLIVTARYLTFSDLLRGVGRWFWLRGLARSSRFRGWSYASLLWQEHLREWGQIQFAQTQLFYLAMRQIAARYGDRVKCLLYPFENQPWEKLLCLAWREQAPQVLLIGYQHSWVPPLLLTYALGAHERQTVPLPDLIVTSSETSLRTLAAGGFPEERLVNGGALRHEYLHASVDGAPPGARDPAVPLARSQRTVLVTFPLHEAQSRWLLADLLEAFQTPLVMDDDPAPVQFILKLHPSLPLKRFYPRPLALPSWMTLSDQPTSEALAQANLLLYAGPTSTWWEAALSGVRVLKYQSDLLDLDAGHGLDGLSACVCTRDTLRSAVSRLLRERTPAPKPDPHLINELFGKVNEALWVSLVRATG